MPRAISNQPKPFTDVLVKKSVVFYFSGTQTAASKAARFVLPEEGKVYSVVTTVNTAPTGDTLICDVNLNGTTIYTTQGSRPIIAAAAKTSTSLAAPDVTNLDTGDVITFDVDQIGSSVAGADLTVVFTYIARAF
jgi:hypothetical protein